MKKAMKKLMAALLAVAMVCAMAIPAFAAKGEPVTSSGVSLTNHDFEAYQIFSAKLDSAGRLSDVEWGNGVKGNELLVALQADTTLGDFSKCNTASDVAEKLATFTTEKATKFAAFVANGYLDTTKIAGTGTIDLLSAGYYLIKDVTEVDGEYDASNLTLLLVSGPETVTPQVKTDIPTLQKKVKDKNDSAGTTTTDWQDSADYDIGDIIPYQLTATLGNVSNFDTYYVEFVDIMDHLTYRNITSVKVGDKTLSAGDYTSNWDSANKKLTVSIDDVKQYNATNGSTITVEYTAILDSDAILGSTGNPNEAYLVFSNNPNGDGYGKTAPDKNIVFTYKVVANKIDQDGKDLPGAAFALYKKLPAVPNPEDGTSYIMEGTDAYAPVKELNVGENGEVADKKLTTFEWTGIDDGEYMIKEIITPTGYNSIEPMKFTVTATHDIEAADPKLNSLTGTLESGEIAFTPNNTEGSLTINIKNNQGTTLPGTGGIGTTIFYVLGSILVIGAAVLLITKKRMSAAA